MALLSSFGGWTGEKFDSIVREQISAIFQEMEEEEAADERAEEEVAKMEVAKEGALKHDVYLCYLLFSFICLVLLPLLLGGKMSPAAPLV